jgi:hypothetical protein
LVTHINRTRNAVVTVSDFLVDYSITIIVNTVTDLCRTGINRWIRVIAVDWRCVTILIRVIAECLSSNIRGHPGCNLDCVDSPQRDIYPLDYNVVGSREYALDREITPAICLGIKSSSLHGYKQTSLNLTTYRDIALDGSGLRRCSQHYSAANDADADQYKLEPRDLSVHCHCSFLQRRQPGGLGALHRVADGVAEEARTRGFASPAFAGFAFIEAQA